MPSDTNSPNKQYKSVSPNDGYQMSDNEPSDGPIQLKKQLGLMNGVGIIVGVIIGSGIFISPKGVLLNAGSVGLSMIVWLSCGLLVMCGALCYAELGTAIPKSGGEFAYLKESFGPLSAFLYLWVTFLIIYPTGNAIIALTFAEYILSPLYSGCKAPELAVQLLAAAVTVFLTFVNCYNVKWSTRITDSVAFAKVVALLIIVFAGLIYLFSGMILICYILFFSSFPYSIVNNQLKDLLLNSPNFVWDIRRYKSVMAFILFSAVRKIIGGKCIYCYKTQDQIY